MAALLPLALVVTFGCQVPGEEEIAQTIENVAPADHVSAEEIFSEYRADSGVADERYKGQVVTIMGVVTEIDIDVFGVPYIELMGGEFAGVSL